MPATETMNAPAWDLHEGDRDGTYLPTPEEIRAACQKIQAGWSESERMRRARGQAGRPKQVTVAPRRYARLLIDVGDRDERAA